MVIYSKFNLNHVTVYCLRFVNNVFKLENILPE